MKAYPLALAMLLPSVALAGLEDEVEPTGPKGKLVKLAVTSILLGKTPDVIHSIDAHGRVVFRRGRLGPYETVHKLHFLEDDELRITYTIRW